MAESAVTPWVIVAGCPISDSTPPRLSASVKSSVREQNSSAASFPPTWCSNHAAEVAHLLWPATSWPGWKKSPG